eukprot:1161562-Pelagomonas_calceolata.AAC.1
MRQWEEEQNGREAGRPDVQNELAAQSAAEGSHVKKRKKSEGGEEGAVDADNGVEGREGDKKKKKKRQHAED